MDARRMTARASMVLRQFADNLTDSFDDECDCAANRFYHKYRDKILLALSEVWRLK